MAHHDDGDVEVVVLFLQLVYMLGALYLHHHQEEDDDDDLKRAVGNSEIRTKQEVGIYTNTPHVCSATQSGP